MLAGREVDEDLRRFERRGAGARDGVELRVRDARAGVERAVGARRDEAERRNNMVTARIADVSNRVEDAAQLGVATGARIASVAKERVSSLV